MQKFLYLIILSLCLLITACEQETKEQEVQEVQEQKAQEQKAQEQKVLEQKAQEQEAQEQEVQEQEVQEQEVQQIYAETYLEGQHYTILNSAQPVETGDKVEVRELFWYGCPHCFKLEDSLDAWTANMPADAEFVRMPAIFSNVWEQHAKIYYTFEAMGNLDEMHKKVFDAIHIDKKKLAKDDEIIEFAVEQGLDKATVEETMESFTVNSKVSAAKANISKYQVTGVPAFIVGGKYLTDVKSAGNEKNMFEIIEFLINKTKAES